MNFNRLRAGLFILPLWLLSAGVAYPNDGNESEVDIRDLDYGNALYEFYQGNYFQAINEINVAKSADKLGDEKDRAEILLGSLYLNYGLINEAEKIFNRLLNTTTTKEIQDKAWFWLGKLRYQKGQPQMALNSFDRVSDFSSNSISKEMGVIRSNIYIQQKNYSRAIEVLSALDKKEDSIWNEYIRFNLAMAKLKSDDRQGAIAELKMLSEHKTTEAESRLIKDRVNLVLGLLESPDNPTQATRYLSKIRLTGSDTNKALLAAGWNYSTQGDYDNALSLWSALNKKPVHERSVAKSYLATAYAIEKLGDEKQSVAAYELAASKYREEIRNLEQMNEVSYANQVLTLYQRTKNGKNDSLREELSYLAEMLMSDDFRDDLASYEELQFLQNNLEHWKISIDSFDHMLEVRKSAFNSKWSEKTVKTKKATALSYRKKLEELDLKMDKLAQVDFSSYLATANEKSQMKALSKLEEQAQAITDNDKREELVTRIKFLSGIVDWTIASDFKPRAWNLVKAHNLAEENLSQAEYRLYRFGRSRSVFSNGVADFSLTIERNKERVDELLQAAKKQVAQQKNLIDEAIVGYLDKRKKQFQDLLVQAQFALVNLYDKSEEVN